jgi:choline dehydrogenase
VAYLREGHEREARASREVVLCAGAIGSPQLLLLSGIGPAEDLRSLGIPVVRELPGVGENLHDHPRVAVTFESRRPLGLDDTERQQALRQYGLDRTGPHSSTGVGAGALVRTAADAAGPDALVVPTADPDAGAWSLHVALLRPVSRGSLRLRTRDPAAHPLIRAGYLTDEHDLDALVRGLAIARGLAGQAALDAYRGRELAPGPEADDLRRHVRRNATTFFHPVGTCRMGADRMAVVDHELRVHGVAGLRVVDASVMPALVAGATHAATVMIAEKGADLLKRSR